MRGTTRPNMSVEMTRVPAEGLTAGRGRTWHRHAGSGARRTRVSEMRLVAGGATERFPGCRETARQHTHTSTERRDLGGPVRCSG
jgi:hypothetical protein